MAVKSPNSTPWWRSIEVIGVVGAIILGLMTLREKSILKPIEQLRVRITGSTSIPDPAHIASAGEWYLLDHISSGLAAFDGDNKQFIQLYAESWDTLANGTHLFRLRQGIRFHDGTPITVKDFVWSIKRQLLLKTATHFPLSDYIVGCDHIKSVDDDCEGIKAISDREISIQLKVSTRSFFLQLASPETAIWSAQDMDPKTGKLTPTKFSGPYFVASVSPSDLLLKRNENSPISKKFPESPRSILVRKVPLGEVDQALMDRRVDLVVRSYRPLAEPDWAEKRINVHESGPSTIIYLSGTGTGGPRAAVGQDDPHSPG